MDAQKVKKPRTSLMGVGCGLFWWGELLLPAIISEVTQAGSLCYHLWTLGDYPLFVPNGVVRFTL